MSHTDDLRIQQIQALAPPSLIREELPISKKASDFIAEERLKVGNILHGKDDRILVVVGPCSIHNPQSAIEYAKQLKDIIPQFQNTLQLVMRVYFEKPRTTVGWKGLINDPDLDGSFHINKGLRTARQLLLDINALEVPCGTEFLDTTIPQYIADLVTWSAIGARTTESQIHRELASGLSTPVGFKNSTTGDIQAAVDAVTAAKHPHHFLGVTKQGIAAIVNTTGNSNCHIILRGSKAGPNYKSPHINEALTLLQAQNLSPYLMVDCSHGNSNKDYKKQADVARSLCLQISQGNKGIAGVMLESNLVAGRQDLRPGHPLVYGQSITDACIDWPETITLLTELATAVGQRRQHSSGMQDESE